MAALAQDKTFKDVIDFVPCYFASYDTNRTGIRNMKCISLSVDNKPFFHGRTPIERYRDYMKSFGENMEEFLESELFIYVEVGLGLAGELRYPSYSECLNSGSLNN